MKQGILIVTAMVALAACEQQVPDSGSGVGFSDYANYEIERARRESALTSPRTPIVPPARVVASATTPVVTAPTVPTSAIPSSELAAAGIGQSNTASVQSVAPPVVQSGINQTAPSNPAPVTSSNPGISDEQSFDAVAGRETIESDAQRRAAQAAAREQIQPTAVPTRPTNTGPNIVEYAINAPNRKGQEWYSRSLLSGEGRFQRNCAAYASPDDAQRDFLARGGPERDRLGIDPDGDGFACGWDPEPFRLIAGN